MKHSIWLSAVKNAMNSNNNFTKGPWEAHGPCVRLADGQKVVIAIPFAKTPEEPLISIDEQFANARLIAQSPLLLEELDALTGELERLGFHDMPGDTMADLRNRFDSARDAINLATGQKP